MKLLVTGGCGFIGSNFVRLALKSGHQVVNLDKLTYAGNPENLRDVEADPNYSFIKGDIADPAAVKQAMRGCDAVLNFAAESHVDRSIESAQPFIQTNVVGTQVLLDAALENATRFVQISTDEVYGSIEAGSFSETDILTPSSPYAASKAGADLLARSYFITHKLPVIVVRSSNNFGPYQFPEKLIPLFITNALEDTPLPLYGDGRNVRDWLFVQDNCAAILTVLEKGVPGEIYNIGAGNERENSDVARTILKSLGKPASLISPVQDRKGHDRRYSIDCAKVKKLDWTPQHTFDEALARTIEWYKSNENWWRPLK